MSADRSLTLRQLQVLAGLDRHPENMAQLGEWLGVHRVTALQATQRLALTGLVDIKTMKLTPKGKKALTSAHATLAASLESVRQ